MEDFKFYIPLDISKGKDKNGTEIMKVSGVASTEDPDSDGEMLIASGFDLSHFLKAGFVNWHHSHNAEGIIGEPTKAFISNNQLHIEAELYPWSDMAKNVYTLAKGLANSNSKRTLGWSIEGKAVERDLINPKIVRKAKIFGVAITAMPKNAQTFLDVVKGNYVECEDEFELSETPNPNGGKVYLLDVEKPNGDRITIDKDFNIKMEKSLTTGSGRALIREHVEGGPKPDIKDKKVQEALVVLQKAFETGKLEECTYNKIKAKFK